MTDNHNEQVKQNGAMSRSKTEVSAPQTHTGQGGGRRYTRAYKLRILAEVDRCEHGEVGALLRREGLYYSTIRKWRKQQDAGRLDGSAKKRQAPTEAAEVKRLQRENARLKKQLAQAEAIIEVQKKVATLLETLDD